MLRETAHSRLSRSTTTCLPLARWSWEQSLGPWSSPYPEELVTELDDRLSDATLSKAQRNTVRRFVALTCDALGDDLCAL